MQVAIDVRSLIEGRHTGVEEYTEQIIRHLIRAAPKHSYHLFYNSFRSVELPQFDRGLVTVHASHFPNKLLNSVQLIANLPRWDRILKVPLDVVLVPNARLTPLSPHVPLVVVAHDLSYERFPEFLDWRRRLWHKLMRPRILMRNAQHVIAVSEHTRQDVIATYELPDDKVTTIHSGIDHIAAPAAFEVQQLRRAYNLPEHFVLSLSTREPRKNIASVIDCWAAIANDVPHHLVLAGEKGWRESHVQQRIEAAAHRGRIHQLGVIPPVDKMALYAAADLFVYPSFYEGYGFPPLESLLAGTPVIASHHSSLPEIVGQWATLIDPYDRMQLAGVMRDLLLYGERISPAVQAEVRNTYTWDAAAQETLKILSSAA